MEEIQQRRPPVMTRRVTEYRAESIDREKLMVVTVFEEGINKQTARRENRYSKRHRVLIQQGAVFEYMKKSI